jgi:hypothetical protein
VSLRRDMHSAFDEITPSTFGLPERVVRTVLAESSTHHNRERMMFRLRAPMSLVAVLIVIAIAAGVLIAGRLVQDWNSAHKASPAGGTPQVLALLEARPLNLPVVHSLAECVNQTNSVGEYGNGPVYIAGGNSTATTWGTYWYLEAFTDVNYKGLVLIRARDLVSQQPVVFIGQNSGGSVVGLDTVSGKVVQQRDEVVIDASHPSNVKVSAGTLYAWNVTPGLAAGYSECVGWQIDSQNGTEIFESYVHG